MSKRRRHRPRSAAHRVTSLAMPNLRTHSPLLPAHLPPTAAATPTAHPITSSVVLKPNLEPGEQGTSLPMIEVVILAPRPHLASSLWPPGPASLGAHLPIR